MKRKMTDNKLTMNLQFFAEPGDGGNSNTPNDGGTPTPNNEGGTPSNQPKNTITLTQDELSKMMTKEKKEGRAAILRELGINTDDAKTNKDVMEKFRTWQESQKTELEKAQEQLKRMGETEKKNAYLELKISALTAGANPATLDDLITLALAKVTEENTIDKVLETLKTTYPMFYQTQNKRDESSNGTGHMKAPQSGGSNKSETLAERLARNKSTENTPKANPYFRN